MSKLIRNKDLTKFKEELKEATTKFVADFEFHEMKNPFRPGDWVQIDHDIKDAYEEVWHSAGAILKVSYLAKDGEGLMFHSDLGTHWTNVQRTDKPSTDLSES